MALSVSVFTLFVVYQVKHFLADYPLQSPSFFIGKFRDGWAFLPPLLAHVAVHAVMTLAIALAWGAPIPKALGLALFDATIHFFMDRLKAGRRYLGRWKALSGAEYPSAAPAQRRSNVLFWNSVGLDQMVHHLTHYAVIWMLVR